MNEEQVNHKEDVYLFRKLLAEYPIMEKYVESWLICYFDDNNQDHYIPCNQHLLHPRPTIEIRDWDVIVKSNKPNGETKYIHFDWVISIIESYLFTTFSISISYKPISMVQRTTRYSKGEVKWKIYKGAEVIRKGVSEFDFIRELSTEVFLPNAFDIISEYLSKIDKE